MLNCWSLWMSYDLTAVDLGYRSHINFTYENSDGSLTSWLDHVLTSQSSALHCLNVSKLDIACNLSDHHPLSVLLEFSACKSFSTTVLSFFSRHKVSDSDLHCYCAQIANCLPSIPVDLIECSDPSCVQHHSHLDQLCSCLFDCI